MNFIWPMVLLWLLAIPALVAAYVYWLRRKKKGAIRPWLVDVSLDHLR